MITLKIKVTKAILERSKWCGTSKSLGETNQNCAIAISVRDVFPEARVNMFNTFFFKSGNGSTKNHPKMTMFISEFDTATPEERVNMPEIEFEINIPDDVIEKINIDEIMPLLENHPTLELATT